MRTLAISLAPTAGASDARTALALLFRPWLWRRGPAVQELTKHLASRFGTANVWTISSARWGLTLLLRALNLPQGSEVLLQAFTCVSVPGPVLWAGLAPVYVDIDPDTYTMDPSDLERKITPRSRVLILQHTFGIPADLPTLLEIARRHRLIVIEDCAHTIGATHGGKLLGTFGDAALLSFGRDKALSSVFGGAVIVHTPSAFPALQAELQALGPPARRWILQQLLHPLLLVGVVRPLYGVASIGKVLLVLFQHARLLSKAIDPEEKSGGKPNAPIAAYPNALAALALRQWERLEAMNAARERRAAAYARLLGTDVVHPSVPSDRRPVYLRYPVRVSDKRHVLARLRREGIILGDWYDVVAPSNTDLAAVGYVPGACPAAERAAREVINVPTHEAVTDTDLRLVARALHRTAVRRRA